MLNEDVLGIITTYVINNDDDHLYQMRSVISFDDYYNRSEYNLYCESCFCYHNLYINKKYNDNIHYSRHVVFHLTKTCGDEVVDLPKRFWFSSGKSSLFGYLDLKIEQY